MELTVNNNEELTVNLLTEFSKKKRKKNEKNSFQISFNKNFYNSLFIK